DSLLCYDSLLLWCYDSLLLCYVSLLPWCYDSLLLWCYDSLLLWCCLLYFCTLYLMHCVELPRTVLLLRSTSHPTLQPVPYIAVLFRTDWLKRSVSSPLLPYSLSEKERPSPPSPLPPPPLYTPPHLKRGDRPLRPPLDKPEKTQPLHKVQHSHCSSIFIDFCQLVLSHFRPHRIRPRKIRKFNLLATRPFVLPSCHA
ncbi:unnamed protein product, partial [Laminaria digitata]